MNLNLPESIEGQAFVIAYLRARLGLSVSEIADATDKSESTINRRLKDAEAAGMLKQYIFTANNEQREKFDSFLRDGKLEKDIVERIGNYRLQSAIVVPTVGDSAENREKVAKFAAARIMEKTKYAISNGRDPKIGISWGRTLRAIVDSINDIRCIEEALVEEKKSFGDKIDFSEVEVLPLCGDFWLNRERIPKGADIRDTQFCLGSRLAADLADCLKAIPPLEMSIPASIPVEVADEPYYREIKRFLERSPAMERLYGGDNPLVSNLDGIITSCGSFPREIPKDDLSFHMALRLRSGLIEENTLEKLCNAGVIGDVLGLFISGKESDGEKESGRELDIVDKVNSSFLGPKLEHFRGVVNLARKDPLRMGVIIVAAGESKSAILLEIINLELVNEIIVDSSLARALMDKLSLADE